MKNIITGLLTLVCSTIFSQTNEKKDIGEINNIVPMSPNAAAFAKYGEIPVSNFTGTANISIPLYTIKTEEFNLPIELSYHTGGNKVEDVASWVGLGWSLGTIPTISRSVKGMPDEEGGIMDKFAGLTTKQLWELPPSDLTSIRFMNAIRDGDTDSEPDIFYFNILGKSGKFAYDQEQNKFVTLEKSQIKISYANGFFTIITEEGYEYLFTEKEITSTDGSIITTSWSVSKISSPNKNEELLFEYEPESQLTNNLNPATMVLKNELLQVDTKPLTDKPTISYTTIVAMLLKKITFNGGTIEFTKDATKRLDLKDGHNLKNIRVKNTKEQLISAYDFNYKYISGSGCTIKDPYTNKWLILEKIKNVSLPARPLEHSFSYEESSTPPCRNSAAQDYWGYYNGMNSNRNLIPSINHRSGPVQGADRTVDSRYTQFAILKKIVYPTGGYTEFVFENNVANSTVLPDKYIGEMAAIEWNKTTGPEYESAVPFTINNPPDVFLNGLAGGAFVKLAMGSDGYEPKPGFADATLSFLIQKPAIPANPQTGQKYVPAVNININDKYIPHFLANGDYTLYATVSDTNEDLTSFFGIVSWYKLNPDTTLINRNRYIGGLRIKETKSYTDALSVPIVKKYRYTVDYESPLSSGKVFSEPKFVFDDEISITGECGDGICAGSFTRFQSYNNVQQITFSGATVGYETVIEESNAPTEAGVTIYKYTHSQDTVNDYFPYPPPYSAELYRGQPQEISYYKKNGAQLTLIEKKEFQYKDRASYVQGDLFKDIFGFKAAKHHYYTKPPETGTPPSFASSYAAANYRIFTGVNLAHSETTTTYFPSGNVTTKKTYQYEAPNHHRVTSESLANSHQETQETKYYYPQDSKMASQPFVNELIAKNRIAAPLNTQIFKSGLKLSEQLTVYDKSTVTTNNLLVPKFILSNKGLAVLDENKDKKITYNKYDEKGNILQYTPDGGLPVSFIWGYNKTQPLVKIENINYDLISASSITNLQNLSDLDNDHCTTATCKEQLLREALNTFRRSNPGQMVTTYTYNPLVGVTSITDPKETTTYYEYDWYGRLKLVKDHNQDVLQRYCYNYEGQYVDCNDDASTSLTLYKSAAKSGSFTKNNCTGGLGGSAVFYSQNAAVTNSTISQQDADNKATTKFNQDGQAHANATGICNYISIARTGTFTRNNCPAGGVGSSVTYSQVAGVEKSTISQEDANAKGLAKFNTDGQAHANATLNCTFYNVGMSEQFTNNSCSSGQGEIVSYAVSAGTYSSTISQQAANDLAQEDISSNGQTFADTYGGCAPN